jgi:hypothetical protein
MRVRRSSIVRGSLLATAVSLVLAACGGGGGTTGQVASSAPPTVAPQSVSPSPSPLSPLVGQWELKRTCAAIVGALTKAGLKDLIPQNVGESIEGVSEDGSLPPTWDPSHPCANAKPPIEHSHTFWADGAFNSYDENGNQVDEDTYKLVDDHTLAFKFITMHYSVTGDSLTLDVVIPSNCTTKRIVGYDDEGHPVRCREVLGWAFSVAYPGQTWTRVTSGPHVPPGTGSSG